MPEAIDVLCDVGEGPYWDGAARQWSWVDNAKGLIFLKNGNDIHTIDPDVKVVAAVPKASGGWLLAAYDGLYDFDEIARPWAGSGLSGTRYNDGKCDALGRFWVGTMSLTGEAGQGALYRVDDGISLIAFGFDVCNGLGFSPDNNWFYLTDTGQRVIYRYRFDLKAGTISDREIFFRFPPEMGKPDGLAVDDQGGIWCAMWDGAQLVRLTPGGTVAETVALPVPRPTSLAFGDGDLLVTTARAGLTTAQIEAAPLSGRPLLYPTDLKGAAAHPFAG